MTDITPGFTFSPGQLVSANNLNKVVGDAIINDESITATKLSEDSVQGAIMGHATMQRSDVSDQDYFLIYDVSESKIKKLAKLDVIGTLNVVFEGGVSAGNSGSQTTIDGSTGAIVMESGNLQMNTGDIVQTQGDIETNNLHAKGNITYDGTISGLNQELSVQGNITTTGDIFVEGGDLIIGNDASIANGDNDLYFSRTNNSIIALGHNGQTFGVTGVLGQFKFEDNLEIEGRSKISQGCYIAGGYRLDTNEIDTDSMLGDIGLRVIEAVKCGNLHCADFYSNNLFVLQNSTFFHHPDSAVAKVLRFSHGTGLDIVKEPKIISYPPASTNGLGLAFEMQSEDPAQTTQYNFVGDKISVFPPEDRVDTSGNPKSSPAWVQIAGRTATTNATKSWYLRAWYPLNGVNIFEIIPDATSSSRLNIGSSGLPSDLQVFGTIASTGTKNFRICHPVLEDKDLLHTAIEAPKADLIYRGKHTLGADPVNLDNNANMAEGTFVKLVKDVQVFVQNNAGWDRVKGRVEGNLLYIDCENAECTDIVDWLVIGERNDKSYKESDETDNNGNFIVERDCLCDTGDAPDSNLEMPTQPIIEV